MSVHDKCQLFKIKQVVALWPAKQFKKTTNNRFQEYAPNKIPLSDFCRKASKLYTSTASALFSLSSSSPASLASWSAARPEFISKYIFNESPTPWLENLPTPSYVNTEYSVHINSFILKHQHQYSWLKEHKQIHNGEIQKYMQVLKVKLTYGDKWHQ